MAEGVRHFQLKLGADPHDDAARAAEVARLLGDQGLLIADANCGWLPQDAVVAARLLDPLDRVYLEQPCRTLEECVAVRRHTTLPMVLDEIILDVPSLLRAVSANALEAFNLKISRVGGLTNARLMRDLAQDLGLRVTLEDTWGGDVTTAAVAHLAASTRPEHSAHGLVHERLDERARRRVPASLVKRRGGGADGPRARHRGRPREARRAALRGRLSCTNPEPALGGCPDAAGGDRC